MQWRSQKMKVKLAAKTFRASVADALEFCRDGLRLEQFENCQGTVDFLRLIDGLFDVMNSRNKFAQGMKGTMKPETVEATNAFLDRAYSCITWRPGMYQQHAGDDKPPKYLLTHKLSQGHLQVFFSAVRGASRFNNNPTVRQLVATYKRLMMRHGPNT